MSSIFLDDFADNKVFFYLSVSGGYSFTPKAAGEILKMPLFTFFFFLEMQTAAMHMEHMCWFSV